MMWKILTAQIMEAMFYTLVATDYFPKNRKDATREQEESRIYCTSISTALRKAKPSVQM